MVAKSGTDILNKKPGIITKMCIFVLYTETLFLYTKLSVKVFLLQIYFALNCF